MNALPNYKLTWNNRW